MKKSFIHIVIIFLFLSCSQGDKISNNDKLIGHWVRYGDKYQGMEVIVKKTDNNYVGIINFAPVKSQKNAYEYKEKKWLHIRKKTPNLYYLNDLQIIVNSYGDIVKKEYYKAEIKFSQSNKFTISYNIDNKKVLQTWIRKGS